MQSSTPSTVVHRALMPYLDRMAGIAPVGSVGVAAIALALLALPSPAAAADLSHTFDTDNHGWLASQDELVPGTSAPHVASGGNPGGHLSVVDTGEDSGGCAFPPCQDVTFSFAPTMSLLPYYGGTLSFDRKGSVSPAVVESNAFIRIYGSAGDSLNIGSDADDFPFTTNWETFSRPFTEVRANYCPGGGATCDPSTESQFRSVIANATLVTIRADTTWGEGESYALDNFRLTEPLPPGQTTPAICTVAGCNSEVSVFFKALPTQPRSVGLCVDGRCASTKVDSRNPDVGLHIDCRSRPDVVKVAVTVRGRGNRVLARASRKAKLAKFEPNGAQCGPTCWTAAFIYHGKRDRLVRERLSE